jgi:hypothetical protein
MGWKEAPVMAQWRKATWALIIWNALMILWLASALQGEFSCVKETGAARSVCDAGASIGMSLGASLVGVVWFAGFITIGLIWLVSRPKSLSQ